MLKRLYIDNFRQFVNFEITFDTINLLLGPNGSGKSSLFDVLRKLQSFVIDGDKVDTLFKSTDLTRWQKSKIQRFELDIERKNGIYKYELAIEHTTTKPRVQIHYERLWFDGKPLVQFELPGDVHLFDDDDTEKPGYPTDGLQSVIAMLPRRRDNRRLTWFRDKLRRWIIVQINPNAMPGESKEEEIRLTDQAENFVSWYRYIYQDQGKAIKITNALNEILDGFDYFKFVETGEASRLLKLAFSGKNGSSTEYRFDELSDGQRALIVLYTLIYYAKSNDYTLCIDEPENYLALPEVQPWLTTLYDLCDSKELQSVLISHHPELINFLAVSAGHWFEYQNQSPVRVKRISGDNGQGLPISELVARGWVE